MKENIFKLIIGVLLLSSTLLMAKTYTINQPSDSDKTLTLVSVNYMKNKTILTMKCTMIGNEIVEVGLSPDDSDKTFEIMNLSGKKSYKLHKSEGIAIIPKWSTIKKKGKSFTFKLIFRDMPLQEFKLVERNGDEYDAWSFNYVNVKKPYSAKKKKHFKKSTKSKIKVLTKKNFKSVINNKSKLVVVKFFATWCGPCKKMKPEFKQASRSLQKQVVYATVNVDDLGKITQSMEVNSIPTTILFNNGHEISRKLSGMNRLEILTWIHSFL